MDKYVWTRRLLLGICAVFYLTLAGVADCWAAEKSADTISAKELWNRQHLYFQKISSLEFDSTMTLILTEEQKRQMQSPSDKPEWRMVFACDGEKYRSEVSFLSFSTGKESKTITAYDGKSYQHFNKEGNAAFLRVSKNIDKLPIFKWNPYMGPNQMLVPFLFVFRAGCPGGSSGVGEDTFDSISLDTLQNAQTWSRLINATEKIQPTSIDGHHGLLVTVRKTEGTKEQSICEIFFAADFDYFPIYWKRLSLDGEVLSKVEVLETKKCGTEGIIIPLHIESKDYLKGKLMQSGIYEILPKTLKVNQEVDEKIFTIPVSQDDINSGRIRYIDLDALKKPSSKTP